jgi:hypothetical protein
MVRFVWGWRAATFVALAGLAACSSERRRDGPVASDAGPDASGPRFPRLAAETERVDLTRGTPEDEVPWEFSVDSGARAGEWSRMPIPSHWEFHGFGAFAASAAPEQGTYRRTFKVPATWAGKRVVLVFEGVLTDTSVSVNGESAGPVHRGGFTRFQYDITDRILPGDNRLEVVVKERSEDASVAGAERTPDAWSLGGIYRPVYLEVYAAEHIDRFAVYAQPNGDLSADIYLSGLSRDAWLFGTIFDARVSVAGRVSAWAPAGTTKLTLNGHIDGVLPWSADTPEGYLLELELNIDGEPRHIVRDRFGFRNVELVAGDGLYVNGKKVKLRGVSYRGVAPGSGLAFPAEWSARDASLLKGMNANAVLSLGHPVADEFLEAADAVGLYVIEGLPGANGESYDTGVGRQLAEELVTRKVNHPSVILWSNGIGGGYNPELDAELVRWDPSARPVLHPGSAYTGLRGLPEQSLPVLEQELEAEGLALPLSLLTAWYDGGGGAGLDDYWRTIRASPRALGGFLSSFADVALRPAETAFDFTLNAPPRGLVDVDRAPEGSVYAIRDVWSPVQIALAALPEGFSGAIPVENRYDFVDLADVVFRWRLSNFYFGSGTGFTIAASGSTRTGSIPPGQSGTLELPLPAGWGEADVLQLDAGDAYGRLIGKWTWMLASPSQVRARIVPVAESADAGVDAGTPGASIATDPANGELLVSAGGRQYAFDASTGRLLRVLAAGRSFAFGNGPLLVGGDAGTLSALTTTREGTDVVLSATYAGDLQEVLWRVMANGWLALRCRYALAGTQESFGVSFDYPEERVSRMFWLGRGPARVWKNRLRGAWHDVWSLGRAQAAPPTAWDTLPFAGYFADVYWLRLVTSDGVISIVLDAPSQFVRLFALPGAAGQTAPFPGGSISLLQGIPAARTEQFAAADLGPQSAPYELPAGGTFEVSAYLRFGDAAP